MESGALLTKSGRPFKHSSIGTARGQLRRFVVHTDEAPAAEIDLVERKVA